MEAEPRVGERRRPKRKLGHWLFDVEFEKNGGQSLVVDEAAPATLVSSGPLVIPGAGGGGMKRQRIWDLGLRRDGSNISIS